MRRNWRLLQDKRWAGTSSDNVLAQKEVNPVTVNTTAIKDKMDPHTSHAPYSTSTAARGPVPL